jgi:tetratricopeptide (TPR) repeat protein
VRARSVSAFVCLLGCGSATESATTPTVTPRTESRALEVADPAQRLSPSPILPGGTLDQRIGAHEKAMRDTRFGDVGIIIELARLQLMRDNTISDEDGQNDAARGKKNAMRAVASDDGSAPGRLVLALAIAQSLRSVAGLDDAAVRATRLRLVTLSASTIPKGEAVVEAAKLTLVGYLALEQGDRGAAKTAFESATKLDPNLAAAWAGLGDARRSDKDYAHALDAYKQAAAYLPDDAGIEEGMKASAQGVVLTLPQASRTSGPVDDGRPLATPVSPISSCANGTPRAGGNDSICAGLDGLARASTPKQFDDAATMVVSGFAEMKLVCEQRDAACGDHVAASLYAAAVGYRRARLIAKSITVLRMLLGNPGLPGAKALTPSALLEIGDQYFALGVFDTAADFYERYVRERGPSPDKARDRAALIRNAFRDAGSVGKRTESGACPSPLTCGVRYLVSDSRWAR